jgi:hypothetical protein
MVVNALRALHNSFPPDFKTFPVVFSAVCFIAGQHSDASACRGGVR